MQSRKPRLLVVDDDAAIREMLRDTLEDAGHVVDEAPDGRAALAHISAGELDLVLLDLMLPGLDGLEVCRQARAAGRGVYLPIIMITALGDDKHRRAGFAAGADDYVIKPFNIADVLDRVGVWLRMRERLRVARDQRFADTEAALMLARAPLQVLLNLTRVLEGGASAADVAQVRTELEQTAHALGAQMEQLSHLMRSE